MKSKTKKWLYGALSAMAIVGLFFVASAFNNPAKEVATPKKVVAYANYVWDGQTLHEGDSWDVYAGGTPSTCSGHGEAMVVRFDGDLTAFRAAVENSASALYAAVEGSCDLSDSNSDGIFVFKP